MAGDNAGNEHAKAVTTLAQNISDEVIMIRRCSEPNQNVRQIYDALNSNMRLREEKICSAQI